MHERGSIKPPQNIFSLQIYVFWLYVEKVQPSNGWHHGQKQH